ncbi:MAG: leucine-rich repeat protein [Prevotellaceae bacterium]|nr:leucine-rich repeat protein [Candidatus Minthosoma equi]
MKKSLLFLSSIALLASCTSDDMFDQSESVAPAEKGIVFQIDEQGTRGQYADNALSSFFYAEKDRVGIYANNVKEWKTSSPVNNFEKKFEYKATQSGPQNPQLTGADDYNILDYKGTNPVTDKAQFFFVYPLNTVATPNYTAGALQSFDVVPYETIENQTMSAGMTMNFDKKLMYWYSGDKLAENKYDGVGETNKVAFKTPLSMLYFSLKDVEDYNDFGNLLYVKLTGTSAKKTSDGTSIAPSALSYAINNAGNYEAADLAIVGGTSYVKSTLTLVYDDVYADGDLITIDGNTYDKNTCAYLGSGVYALTSSSVRAKKGDAKPGTESNYHYEINTGSIPAELGDPKPSDGDIFRVSTDNSAKLVKGTAVQPTTITTTVNQKIQNDQKVNMFVLSNDRVTNDVTDAFALTYSFDNVDLTYTKKSTGAYWKPNASYGFPAKDGLSIASEFQYILTRGAYGTDRTLYINSGTVASILNEGGATIKWTDNRQPDGKVPFDNVNKIVIKKDVTKLTDADWAVLNKLTAAKILEIHNATDDVKVKGMTALQELTVDNAVKVEKSAGATDLSGFGANAANIKKVILPKVTSWKDNNAFAALTDLNIASYDFVQAGEEVADLFFNNNTKATLTTVNIHACASLAPVFGHARKILFTDYTALKEITVADNCVLNPYEFSGCTNLDKVTGIVDITNGEHAFQNCYALRTININGREIPDWCFGNDAQNTGVKNVLYNGKQVAPTSVGERAFSRNSSIEVMDLKECTEIGAFGFNRAINFVGNTDATPVVKIPVETAKECIFYNTKVDRIFAKNVKTVEVNAFSSSTLKQVKFGTKLDAVDAGAIQSPATPANVDIFVVDNADKALFTGFASVTKEAADKWPW